MPRAEPGTGGFFAVAREARGGGVYGMWSDVVPPLEERCPQGSEANRSAAMIAKGNMGPLEARCCRGFLWVTFWSWFSSCQAAWARPKFGR